MLQVNDAGRLTSRVIGSSHFIGDTRFITSAEVMPTSWEHPVEEKDAEKTACDDSSSRHVQIKRGEGRLSTNEPRDPNICSFGSHETYFGRCTRLEKYQSAYYKEEFVVPPDASDAGIGAFMAQVSKEGTASDDVSIIWRFNKSPPTSEYHQSSSQAKMLWDRMVPLASPPVLAG